MPLNVTIDINGDPISQFRIGRTERLDLRQQTHQYLIAEVPVGTWASRSIDWDIGIPFEHRYGDGAEVCVEKALKAWREAHED